MADETRQDGNRYDGNKYDSNRSDPSRGVRDDGKAHDYIKSQTPEERRALRDTGTVKRLQDTDKGFNGSVRKGNTTTVDPIQVGGRQINAQEAIVTGCMGGVRASGVGLFSTLPAPI